MLGTLCSEENRATTSGLQTCLDAISTDLFSTDRFWFGSQYATLCPNGLAGGIPCFNSRPYVADSMMTRLFDTMDYAPQLDRFLKMTYESTESKKPLKFLSRNLPNTFSIDLLACPWHIYIVHVRYKCEKLKTNIVINISIMQISIHCISVFLSSVAWVRKKSSCQRLGSNRGPLGYSSNTLPRRHKN